MRARRRRRCASTDLASCPRASPCSSAAAACLYGKRRIHIYRSPVLAIALSAQGRRWMLRDAAAETPVDCTLLPLLRAGILSGWPATRPPAASPCAEGSIAAAQCLRRSARKGLQRMELGGKTDSLVSLRAQRAVWCSVLPCRGLCCCDRSRLPSLAHAMDSCGDVGDVHGKRPRAGCKAYALRRRRATAPTSAGALPSPPPGGRLATPTPTTARRHKRGEGVQVYTRM